MAIKVIGQREKVAQFTNAPSAGTGQRVIARMPGMIPNNGAPASGAIPRQAGSFKAGDGSASVVSRVIRTESIGKIAGRL